MTSLFIAGAILLFGGGLLMAWPVLRGRQKASGAESELAVYRDQLLEIDRDLARGVIDEAAAKAARNEIERRILRTHRWWQARSGESLTTQPVGKYSALAIALFIVPVTTVAVYLTVGSPQQPDQPFASRTIEQDTLSPEIIAMVAGLETRLAENPNDLEGWQRLARSKQVMGRPDEAVDALRQAIAIAPDDLETKAALGEALVSAAAGVVTPEAQTVFQEVQAGAPMEPRSGYFLGLAEAQAGNGTAAVRVWRELILQTPPDAPWRDDLISTMVETAERMELNVPALIEAATQTAQAAPPANAVPPGIDPDEFARMQSLSQEERQAEIERMVTGLQERLQTDGGSAEEWQRLGRALSVLDRVEPARAAFAQAVELAPDNLELRRDYAVSLMERVDPVTNLPTVTDAAKAEFDKILAAQPDDAEVYWYIGVHALQQRDADGARTAWQQALDLLPADHPDRPTLEQFVQSLTPQ